MKYTVISVKVLEEYKLLLEFKDNKKKVFDCLPYLNWGKFTELKDKNLFQTVKVKFDTIGWDNQLDIDPEFLYEKGELV